MKDDCTVCNNSQDHPLHHTLKLFTHMKSATSLNISKKLGTNLYAHFVILLCCLVYTSSSSIDQIIESCHRLSWASDLSTVTPASPELVIVVTGNSQWRAFPSSSPRWAVSSSATFSSPSLMPSTPFLSSATVAVSAVELVNLALSISFDLRVEWVIVPECLS